MIRHEAVLKKSNLRTIIRDRPDEINYLFSEIGAFNKGLFRIVIWYFQGAQ